MFHPLFRLYLPVMVQVGAQVAVTAKPGTGIILQQQQHKHTQGVLLEKGACIGRATALVKTAFVADTNATCIPPPDMGTRQGQGTQGLDVAVLANIKMITCAGEAPAQVVCRQVVLRIAAVAAGGGTINDDKIDESHENKKLEIKN